MVRRLIVEPEDDFHTLFGAALAQAGYVAIEAANSYEGLPVADAVCRAAVRRAKRAPTRARLLIVEPAAQFHAFFRAVLVQEGYVVTAAVPHAAGRLAADAAGQADVWRDIRYLVVY